MMRTPRFIPAVILPFTNPRPRGGGSTPGCRATRPAAGPFAEPSGPALAEPWAVVQPARRWPRPTNTRQACRTTAASAPPAPSAGTPAPRNRCAGSDDLGVRHDSWSPDARRRARPPMSPDARCPRPPSATRCRRRQNPRPHRTPDADREAPPPRARSVRPRAAPRTTRRPDANRRATSTPISRSAAEGRDRALHGTPRPAHATLALATPAGPAQARSGSTPRPSSSIDSEQRRRRHPRRSCRAGANASHGFTPRPSGRRAADLDIIPRPRLDVLQRGDRRVNGFAPGGWSRASSATTSRRRG